MLLAEETFFGGTVWSRMGGISFFKPRGDTLRRDPAVDSPFDSTISL